MAECHVNKTPRSDHFKDVHFFLKGLLSLVHGKLLPVPPTADQFARQNTFNAELFYVAIV